MSAKLRSEKSGRSVPDRPEASISTLGSRDTSNELAPSWVAVGKENPLALAGAWTVTVVFVPSYVALATVTSVSTTVSPLEVVVRSVNRSSSFGPVASGFSSLPVKSPSTVKVVAPVFW
jgi:hypothetical protein